MPCLASFVPERIDIEKDEVKELVLLKFTSGEDHVDLIFPRTTVGPIMQDIIKAGRFEPPPRLEPRHLSNALTFERFRVGRLKSRNVGLEIYLRSDDGVCNLSLAIPPDEALGVAEQLIWYATTEPDGSLKAQS